MKSNNHQIDTGLKSILLSAVFALLANTSFAQSLQAGSLYLGQTPPGKKPKALPLSVNSGFFAAERIAISNNGSEIYYSELKGYYPNTGESVKQYSYSGGKWTGPVTIFKGYAAPALSVTGDTMYVETNFETYFSVRNRSGWTTPKRILQDLDSAHYYHVTGNGNYYISSKSGKGVGLSDWCKVSIFGTDTTLLSIGRPVNSSGEDLDFFVSHDESFMIVTNRPGLAICFRKIDGSWTNPIGLGKRIDFGLGSWGPMVTPDNKYLFYSTGTKPDYSDVAVYWVRIDGVIDSIKSLTTANHAKLNQVELMKQFAGTWKCELGKDTLLIVENTPFGTGMISSSQTAVKGKNLDSVKQLYGYDKKIDRFIIAEQIKSSPVIEICNAWFTSETCGEIVITNPEDAPLRFTFEFMTPDLIVQRAILKNKVVKEISLIRLKNNERE